MELTFISLLKIGCIGGVIAATVSTLMPLIATRFGWEDTTKMNVTSFIRSLYIFAIIAYCNNTSISLVNGALFVCVFALIYLMPWKLISQKIFKC